MNIFKLDQSIVSYKKPILKIGGAITVCVLVFFLNKYSPPNARIYEMIRYAVCSLLIFPSIMSMYISLAEIGLVYNRRHLSKKGTVKSVKVMDINHLAKLLEKNDIITVELLINEKVVFVGTSSECHHNSSIFYNKQYFIGEMCYHSTEDFMVAFLRMINSQKCNVISIDGLDPQSYFTVS